MAPFFLHQDFLDFLRMEKRYSEHTVLAYQKDVEEFSDFHPISSQGEVRQLTKRDVRSWVVELIDKERENSTIHRKISSLRRYLDWLLKEEKIEKNVAKNIQLPKKSKSLPSFAQESELDEIKLNGLFADDFEGVRDRLMFELLYQTGIRLSELMGLKTTDISHNSIKVLGKRNKERVIPISNDLKKLLLEYSHLRSSLLKIDSDHFIMLNNGKKLYPNFVYRKINYYLTNVTKISKRSPHVLRHTFATHMLNNGAGLEVLKELLGHADLSATQVYTHNSFAELTEIYSRSHPRGHKER